MGIKFVPDLGAPLAVVAVDQITKRYAGEYNEYIRYGMAGVGYVMGAMNFGGDFAKNIGVSSLPLAVDSLVTRLAPAGGVTRNRRLAMERVSGSAGGRVSRFPAPARDSEFQDVRLD